MSRYSPRFLLLPLFGAVSASVQAMDFNVSGFGTAGFAQSDKPYHYQRFIDEEGTFTRDSILGVQADVKFTSQFGATVQGKLAPSAESDRRWDATLSWAFVSWRPTDEWLVRVGKLRLPFMLNTENADVGATYDFARLPMEVYSIAPTTDVLGLSISKTWLGDKVDWTLEGYTGRTEGHWRYYGREIRDGSNTPGSWFLPINIKSSGLVLTAKTADDIFRAGVHEVEVARVGTQTGTDIVRNPTPIPGVGVYNLAPGGVEKLIVPVYNLGASVLLPQAVRVTGEYALIRVNSASEGLSRWGAYLSVSRRFGEWTPYVYFAKMKSADGALEQWKRINGNRLPVLPPPFGDLNSRQKLLADIVMPMDQSTLALGTSWRVSANGLVKAEWAHVRTGVASGLVDAPSGSDSGGQHLNVYSVSYNFTF